MKIGKRGVKIFKMKNRVGFAATCCNHLTEGKTRRQAVERMVKALNRTSRKAKKKRQFRNICDVGLQIIVERIIYENLSILSEGSSG